MPGKNDLDTDVTGRLAGYISHSGRAELPPEVVEKAKHHILDSLAAIIFGSSLKPGRLAIKFIQSQGGVEEAQVAGINQDHPHQCRPGQRNHGARRRGR